MSQFSKTRHKLVGMGGTFDHFHAGHKFFLTYASEVGFKLLIGVTTAKMIGKKRYPATIQPYGTRVRQVKEYCQQQGIQCEVFPLDNPYGPTIERETRVKALCVTKETVSGAEKINTIRAASGARPLPVYVANMILDENGAELHADRIRAGNVNRAGKVYANVLAKTLTLNDEQKSELAKPLGPILTVNDLPAIKNKLNGQSLELPICVVGDYSLAFFIENQLKYDLGIFDGKQQRQVVSSALLEQLTIDIEVANPAGNITSESSEALQKVLSQPLSRTAMFVHGEEDVLTAALILLLPLHARVYYGQPGRGMVEVLVTEQIKERIYSVVGGSASQ